MNIIPLISARMLLLSFVLIAFPTLAQAASVDAHVINVIGNATLTLPTGKKEQITRNMTVPAGSQIQTASDGKIVIQWVPGAFSVISPDTTIAVNSLKYNVSQGKPQRKVALNLTNGTLFNRLKHNDGQSDFSIKTPKGVAAARGTQWSVTVDGVTQAVSISVTESTVQFSSSLDQTLTIGITAGHLYSVTDAGGNEVLLSQSDVDLIMSELKLIPSYENVADPIPGHNDLNLHGDDNTLRETPLTNGQFDNSK